MLTARELMTEAPATVRPTTRVRTAVEMLETLEIRHLPVVDDDGQLIGMLSDRDLRALSIPRFLGGEHVVHLRAALDARVSAFMSSDVVSVDAEADTAEVVDLILENKVGAVPVTDADGALVGIISYVDILRTLSVDALAAE